jgi:uncharacterized protein YgiB involved in biofilm formation
MKRSHAVSLVMLAGVGAAAWGLAQLDPSQKSEEVATFGNESECVQAGQRQPEDCRAAFTQAQAAHERTAPRFESLSDCETQHGAGRCEMGSRIGAAGYFVPAMIGFMMARNAAQGLRAQPLYGAGLVPPPPPPQQQQQQPASGGGGGGGGGSWSSGRGSYRTSSGAVVESPGAAGFTRAPASEVRSPPTGPRVVSRGGFGSTGRSVSVNSGS